jgi:chromosome segregation ATPase
MKRFLSALLAMFGLVPARRHHLLLQQAGELKASVASWKAKATEATGRAKSLEQEVRRQRQITDKTKAVAHKARQRQVDLETVQARLQHAERELAGAREHLMVIEVKLDILEGAANVLDARTRTAVARPSGGTGAPA